MNDHYRIVIENDPAKLEKRVNELLADGWILCGGLVVVPDPDCWLHYQAVKRPKDIALFMGGKRSD